MAQSKAHADRENVERALRGHGFDAAGIQAMFDAEAEITRRKRVKVAPVEAPTLFDF